MKLLQTKKVLGLLLLGAIPGTVGAQITFVNANSRLTTATHSGVGISVVDMDGDGMDDIARMDQGYQLRVEKQRTGQQFVSVPGGNTGGSSAWSMVIGDADENGYRDVVAGFGSGASLTLSNGTGTGFAAAATLPNSNYFLQNMNFMDVDNDGDVDIFGCNDVGMSKIWVNNGSGVYTISNIINFDVSPTDDSGNYGSIWTDFDNDGDVDFFIAKCRQGVNDINDERRISILFVNNGNGTYTENGAAYGLRLKAQTWTASFEDINNDGWFDVYSTHHDVNNKLLLNDGTAHFSDINVNNGAGLNINFTPYQSKMADFDNDGFVDVLVTGSSGNANSARLFRNNGNNTFSPVTTAFPSGNAIHSFGIGDLNHDGRLDIYAGYATGYTSPSGTDDVLWLNNTANQNHFITFTLQGTVSNRDALGARVFIYGDWGVQTREVRAGESYGNCNSFNLHFGLGSATSVDSVIINWPAGGTTKLFDKPADQFITVIEGQCSSPNNNITYNGNPVICPGQSITLNAPAGGGYTYLWSNGATTQTIQANTTGEYSVKVTSGACSSISPIVIIDQSPDETPTISAAGPTKFCDGDQVVLQGPAGAAGYHWTGGATTQNLTVTAAGTYTLTIDGSCQQFTSAPITVEVLANAAPTANGATILNSGSVTLTATGGNNVKWYDQPVNGTLLQSGNSYTTPVISTTTTYYVEGTNDYPGTTNHTAPTDHAGSSQFSGSNTTNATTSFTVLDNCVLKSVKVYTDLAGTRLVQVKNAGGTVVASASVNIPVTVGMPGDAARIDLNFNLAPGTYTIVTDAATNTTNFGYAGPRLRRTNGGITYPFTIANVLSVTGCSEGNNLFYYFYDWEVVNGEYNCVSERAPVVVTVVSDAGVNEFANEAGLTTYPNPTSGVLNVKAEKASVNGATLKVLDVTGKTVMMEKTVNIAQGNVKTIDVSGLAAGVYTLQIGNGQTTYTAKFIVR